MCEKQTFWYIFPTKQHTTCSRMTYCQKMLRFEVPFLFIKQAMYNLLSNANLTPKRGYLVISQKEMSTFFLLPLLIVFPLPLFSFFHIPISLLRPSSLTLFLPFFYVLLPLPIFELQVLHISRVYNQHFVIRHVNKRIQNFYLDIQLKHKRTFPNCFFLSLPFPHFFHLSLVFLFPSFLSLRR